MARPKMTAEQKAAAAELRAAARAAAEAAGAPMPPDEDPEDQPDEGCVFMFRDDERANVNTNSIEIMAALGWSLKA